MENLSIINEAHFLILSTEQEPNDNLFLEKIFKMYFDRSHEIFHQIEKLLIKNEFELICDELHSLQGISSVLGLDLISFKCFDIEKKIKNKDFEMITHDFELLKEIRTTTLDELSKRIFVKK